MYSNPKKIGTLTLSEPHIYTIQYETASWYTKVEVQPGTFDLIATFQYKRAYWIMVGLPGRITEEYMPSTFGYGLPIGDGRRPERIGQVMTYHGQSYAFVIAKALVEAQSCWNGIIDIPLGDALRLTESPMSYGDGREGVLYGLELP